MKNPDSVLESVKEMLGMTEEYTYFNHQLINHINTALMIFAQEGIVVEGTKVDDEFTEWEEIIGDRDDVDGIKTALYRRVQMMFDVPQSSQVAEAAKSQIDELEWRLNVTTDKY